MAERTGKGKDGGKRRAGLRRGAAAGTGGRGLGPSVSRSPRKPAATAASGAAAPKRPAKTSASNGKPAGKAPAAKPARKATPPAAGASGRSPPRRAKATPARKTTGTGARGSRRRPPRKSLGRRVLSWCILASVWGMVALVGVIAYFAYTLPDIDKAADTGRRPGIVLLGADNRPVIATGDLYGERVRVRTLPKHVPQAVLAIEDRRFYEHTGVDILGVLRALWVNLMEGGVRQGGSTITQQLAKNLFLTPERSIGRKIRESMLALWLEWRYGKDQILSLYLNRAYFGAGAYGIDAASRRYFGKPAAEADLWEAAVLAGLLKAPSRLSPRNDPDRAAERARTVLRTMAEAGFIDAERAERAKASRISAKAEPDQRRYFGDWILDEVHSSRGFVDRDLRVSTTFDPKLQRIAAETVAHHLAESPNPAQAALVAMSPDGAVRAIVGGRDYASSQFNRATQAIRQPGSAFKLFVFLAAAERGILARSNVRDDRLTIGGWSPRNFEGRYNGRVTAREAFASSLNAATVRLADRAGLKRVQRAARRLGIRTAIADDLTIALGSSGVRLIELTGAYATFANGGRPVMPYGVRRIRDGDGRPLYRRRSSGAEDRLDSRIVASMNDMLAAVVRRGTGRKARIDRPAGGKTGTSQSHRDAWFIGFTGNLVAGVWVGNDDGKPMEKVTGGGLPAEIWRDFMTAAHEGLRVRPLPGVATDVGDPSPAFDGDQG